MHSHTQNPNNSNLNNPNNLDTLITHANIATMSQTHGFGADNPYGAILDGAIGIKDGKIVWVGRTHDLPKDICANTTINTSLDSKTKWLTPTLIDCHTHLVYAGNRSNEFEARLTGLSYENIAKNGGGILSSVNATRQASFDELYRQSLPRFLDFVRQGVATIEIKSGYGLDLASERKMLAVAKKLGDDFGICVKKTYLAAHALPPEYQNDNDGYITQVCEWLKVLHAEGLIDAVDAFCERIAFDTKQVARVFDVAKSLGLPVKLHAEQLSDMQGASMVASYGGLSADHIEYLSLQGVNDMAQAGTVGLLLPTAFYTLRESRLPPLR